MDSIGMNIWYDRLHTMLSTRQPMIIDGRKVQALIWRECDLRVLIDDHCFDVYSKKYVFTDTDNSHDYNLQRMEHDITLTYMNNRDEMIEAYNY
ncbi:MULTISPECIES: hypothetical protein [unclassified Photobacterium]|uniref:hypothetical protein n=1 Tax=unclassified Photobacterium TaxID=2628852 RepID=UPI001EDD0801|nr:MULTISPECIES: hypothetical protein [unclassified Photobacterium]MCG3863919.1 hypothetical protein [Photobacterium sp. Ph6]MCG3875400.1 hypothetical protein [Photobacterium sp. Ph5]